jgi:hypothetical protein
MMMMMMMMMGFDRNIKQWNKSQTVVLGGMVCVCMIDWTQRDGHHQIQKGRYILRMQCGRAWLCVCTLRSVV